VRGIEVHGSAVDRAIAGHRAAINLGGVAVEDLARGDLLAHPGRVAASHILDVELRHLATSPGPLGPRTKVLVHHGTTQVLATLALVGTQELAPGATTLAQLRVDATAPLGALPDDHFIVRGFVQTSTHGSTIGGGRIIRVLAPKARKGGADHAHAVSVLAAARMDQSIALHVRNAAFAGLSVDDLVRRLGIPASALADPLATLVAAGDLLDIAQTHYLHAQAVAETEAKILAKLAGDAVSREELRTQLPAALPVRAFDAILANLEKRGSVVSEADRVRKATAPARTALSPLETKLADQLKAAGLEAPRPKDLATAASITEAQMKTAIDRLVAAKVVVRIKPDLFMHAEVVANIQAKLVAFLDANKTIDAQQWKDLTGASRKFTIPLAEYFDAIKLTLRVGDLRRKR
jgi:selenocysteine-specific elongation factor